MHPLHHHLDVLSCWSPVDVFVVAVPQAVAVVAVGVVLWQVWLSLVTLVVAGVVQVQGSMHLLRQAWLSLVALVVVL